MTMHISSAQDFIQSTFSPVVASICSPAAKRICQRNSLTFPELVKPFSRLEAPVQVCDASGIAVSVKNVKINILDVEAKPPQPALARKYLNSSVAAVSEAKNCSLQVGNYQIDIPAATPWFEEWRETFLGVQFPSEHEFFKHFLGCIVVVAVQDGSVLDAVSQLLSQLAQHQNTSTAKLPKWFSSALCQYYVLLHDRADGSSDAASEALELLKQTYGSSNCCLLQVDFRPPAKGADDELASPSPFAHLRHRWETAAPYAPTPDKDAAEVATDHFKPLAGNHPLSPDMTPTETLGRSIEGELSRDAEDGEKRLPFLRQTDVDTLKRFVQEFCTRCLVPYSEKQIQLLNEAVSNRKGMSKSLLSATKRWFSNKPGAQGSATATNAVVYASESPELQLRRLGDLYFMFGHYSTAFQVYHSAKRDFNADQAWLHYAGALEMAALSAFMMGEVSRKTFDYMEESIDTYLNACRMPQFATRATLLSTECLKTHSLHAEAANQFNRMTSEDSDLRSALLLEQAAYCFLQCTKTQMVRKYAFHIVLAGHRYSKANQRRHSLRCYKQAHQVYKDKCWSLAEDHIHFTIGKQAGFLKELHEATNAFAKLFSLNSRQGASQQAIFYKEYLQTHCEYTKVMHRSREHLPLSLPILDGQKTRVLLSPSPPLSAPGRVPASGLSFAPENGDQSDAKWAKLEELLVQEAQGALPMIFRPTVSLFTDETSSSLRPASVLKEPVYVNVHLQNPLQIPLPMRNIHLLWTFSSAENEFFLTNEKTSTEVVESHVLTNVIGSVNIPPNSVEEVTLSVLPLAVGELVLKGLCYTLVGASESDSASDEFRLEGKQTFQIKGTKVRSKDLRGAANIPNRRLEISVCPAASCLQATFAEVPGEVLCNGVHQVNVELTNTGSRAMRAIHLASSTPELFYLKARGRKKAARRKKESAKSSSYHVQVVELPESFGDHLPPGKSFSFDLWLRAPPTKGQALIDLLFYYESVDDKSQPSYRLLRHVWQLSVQDSLNASLDLSNSAVCSNAEELTLALKMTNSNQVHHAVSSEIAITQIHMLSRYWQLSDSSVAFRDVKLASQESSHLLLKACRLPKALAEPSLFGAALPGAVAAMHDSKPFAEFAMRLLQSSVARPQPGEPPQDLEGVLIVQWASVVTDSSGQKCRIEGSHDLPVANLVVGPKAPSPDQSLVQDAFSGVAEEAAKAAESAAQGRCRGVTFNLSHPSRVLHDFASRRTCIVDLVLHIHNRSGDELLVKLQTRSGSGAERSRPRPAGRVRWLGPSVRLQKLASRASVGIGLRAALPTPGTFDLAAGIDLQAGTGLDALAPIDFATKTALLVTDQSAAPM